MFESYLMIKPDGQRYLQEIEEMILNSGFSIKAIYHVCDWENISFKIYQHCLSKHDELFKLDFLAHVWINKYLFGNKAAIMVLSKKNVIGTQLLEEIMRLKRDIRTRFNATKNGTFMIIADMEKIGFNTISNKGYLCIKSKMDYVLVDEYLPQIGTFRAFFLQYIHCPDANTDEAQSELTILKKENIISLENIITQKEWYNMKKYRSLECK